MSTAAGSPPPGGRGASVPVLAPLLGEIAHRARCGAPAVVVVAGAVSVGKSTFAAQLAALLAPLRTSIVGTDGFLHPNALLQARGWLEEKGQPHTYDETAIVSFMAAARRGSPDTGPVTVPVYSHEVFDVTGARDVPIGDVLIVEGVNALQPAIAEAADVRVYVEADELDVVGWFAHRFEELTDAARRSGAGFYTRFAALDRDALSDVIRYVWDTINGPNLHRHIAPSRGRADWVVRKRSDHAIAEVVRGERRPSG